MLSSITASFPTLSWSRGHVTTRYSPFRRCPPVQCKQKTLLARLACLIHAANVHSEPGSNPSILYRFTSACRSATHLGEIKFKPKVEFCSGAVRLTTPAIRHLDLCCKNGSRRSASLQCSQTAISQMLNSTEVSSPNCQRSVNREARWFRLGSADLEAVR